MKLILLAFALRPFAGRRARPPAGAEPAPARRATAPPPRRGPLLALMLGSLAVGAVVMVVFHAPVTRVIGVTALFTFIVSGVFLIADPAFLAADEGRTGAEGGEP